jgi:hypothetical protein
MIVFMMSAFASPASVVRGPRGEKESALATSTLSKFEGRQERRGGNDSGVETGEICPDLGGLQIPCWLGSDPPMGWWLGLLAPATLEFWVRFPNERNQGKQGDTLC